MEFARVENPDIVDFTLPGDSERTQKVLASANPGTFDFRLGATRWGIKEWITKIYPPKTKDNEFLSYYCKSFNSVELNASFYSLPAEKDVLKWKQDVNGNPDFKFIVKFPQNITHIRRLKNAEEQTKEFYDRMSLLGEHCTTAFIQIGDNFTPKAIGDLINYLTALPKHFQVFVELRHKQWFEDPAIFELLANIGIGAVITDAAGRRDCAHMELTVPVTMVRFVGNHLHPTDFKRLDEWVTRLKAWKEQGLQSASFFIHDDEQNTLPLCEYLIKKVNQELDLTLPSLKSYPSALLF